MVTSSISAEPSTSIPIKQSSIVRDFAANTPSTIKHDFAFEIVTLSSVALPIEEIVSASQTPALWEPGPVV